MSRSLFAVAGAFCSGLVPSVRRMPPRRARELPRPIRSARGPRPVARAGHPGEDGMTNLVCNVVSVVSVAIVPSVIAYGWLSAILEAVARIENGRGA
jgi:hypothetical protein